MRKWLQALVDRFLSAVAQLQDTPAGRAEALRWATWMRQQWAEYGLVELKQQRNLMTDVRKAIKTHLGESHLALESMNFTVAEWTFINHSIQDQVARRNENVVLLDNPDAIVAQAVRLLESREWSEIAAGLVVLTGRRSSEILSTANFEPKSQWSVVFSGALKRRDEAERLSFEIPTLTTADRVIAALAKLRLVCSSQGLSAEQINQKYSQAVAAACDRHFSQLVPNRDGRDNLFTHLFRSVYAAIATFWYAPPTVDANEYKAAIQGHYAFSDATDRVLQRSLTASRHYNDYKIGDRVGNIDGRQGIKLGYGGVKVIEAFKRSSSSAIGAIANAGDIETSKIQTSKIQDFKEQENSVMASTHPEDQQFFESISQALESLPVVTKPIVAKPIVAKSEPKAKNEPRINDAQAFKQRSLRRMKSILVDLDLLKRAAEKLGIEIRRGKGKGYDLALSEILVGLEQGAILHNPTMPDLAEIAEIAEKLPQSTSQPTSEPSEPSESIVPIAQTIADQAKTLAWLTGRVEALEADLVVARQEKEKEAETAANLVDSAQPVSAKLEADTLLQQQVEQLYNENQQLNAELQETRSRLEGIQQFLGGAISVSGQSSEPEIVTLAGSAKQPSSAPDIVPDPIEKISSVPTIAPLRTVQLGKSPEKLDLDVLRALDAIFDYNDHVATSHQERWTISIPIMKDLLKQVGKATQPKIDAVLKAKSEKIESHHKLHGLGERHNRVHKGTSISNFIKL